MKPAKLFGLNLRRGLLRQRFTHGILLTIFALGSASLAYGQKKPAVVSNRDTAIPIAEFSRMVQEFSEEGGYFPADNFTSNETSYLHIVERLKELGVSGGAYIGVGPEQNF